MKYLSIDYLQNSFLKEKETHLHGKWIQIEDIMPLFVKHQKKFDFKKIGTSEKNKPIYSLKIGTGKKRILLWSQMHGNESTGTKALLDFFNCFSNNSDEFLSTILKECTLFFIPMLNPDGAKAYTRVNANQVDLNRDAVDRRSKESKLLRHILEDFNPQFCFNLHDQRTIFSVEGTKNPATISFLAPSEEISREITAGRKETMNVIISMNEVLQKVIPGCVGRYTDEFYPTATGDNFQKLGYNTILIESGHFPEDYTREESRKFTFYAIFQGVYHIANNEKFEEYQEYFTIPNNDKIFYDVIHRYQNSEAIGFQYIDSIIENKFVSTLEKVIKNDANSKIGHVEIDFDIDLS